MAMNEFYGEVTIGGKFIGDPLISYDGGTKIHGGWINCGNLRMIDVEARVRSLGYGVVLKIGYIEPRFAQTWKYITMVNNEVELRKMWEEAEDFGFIQIYIETDDELNIDEPVEVHIEDVPDAANSDSYIDGNYDLRIEEDVDNKSGDSDVDSESGGSDENGSDNNDEEYMIAIKNRKQFRSTIVDHGQGLGLDDLIETEVNHNGTGVSQGGASKENQLQEEDNPVSEYEDSGDEGYDTPYSSDENDLEINPNRRKKKAMVYNPKCDHNTIQWVPGMIFLDAAQLKEAVQRWGICCGYDIKWMRSGQKRLEARCQNKCLWRLYAAKKQHEKTVTIRKIVNDHKCHRKDRNRQANSSWLAKEFLNNFRKKPTYGIDDMQAEMKDKYGITVTNWVCYRARHKALSILRGSLEAHYAKLHSYKAELLRVDRDGTFDFDNGELTADGKPVFKRFYVGFSSLRKGYLEGCRPVLCLDGCFSKTLIGGALLSAVARDGNNQMYPVSWAVVEGENEHTWRWFLTKLFDDINVSTGLGLTLISDKQKGLAKAITELVPHAEHRNCAKHVHANWKKKYSDQAFKSLFWKAANATHEASYNKYLKELKELNQNAHDDFNKQGPKYFCKSFISTYPKCDAITSNLAETFNGYICRARLMPIINMLEEIRTCLMERIYQKNEMMKKYDDVICPRIREKVEVNKYSSRFCVVKPAGRDKFQIAVGEDGFVVSLSEKTCTCRAWDISGIPCSHAIAAIFFKREDVEDYVDPCYSKNRYFEVYKHSLEPLNGPKMWPEVTAPALMPPPYKKMPGRPRKKRKKAPDEEPKQPGVARRFGIDMTCQHCLNTGHNTRGCPFKHLPPAQRPEKAKRGRPRKNQKKSISSTIEGRSTSSSSVPANSSSIPTSIRAQSSVPSSSPRYTKNLIAQEKRKTNQGYGIRIFSDTGNIYARMPGDRRAKYVSSAKAIAEAARDIQSRSTQIYPSQSSNLTQVPGTQASQSSSVMFKSTASQSAAPQPVIEKSRELNRMAKRN